MVKLPETILVAAVLLAPRHPMHTSSAEVRQERPGAQVEIAIRVFADDLATAVPRADAPGGGADSAVAAYVRDAFAITDRNGRQVSLRWQRMDRAGDVLVVRLTAEPRGGLRGAAVVHGVLLERFDDQVNVVRAAYEGRTATFLFVPGDGAKRLP